MVNRKLKKLKLTEIQPQGWLKKQLQIQMEGLSGRLYEIWDSVGSYSGWLGGTGENWERAPYYLDGLVPLSYYLGDEERWQLCGRFIEWTLQSQDETGNFGPYDTKKDYWSRFAMLKVLIQYQEISDDTRVVGFLKNYFSYMRGEMKNRPVKNWSKARVPDLIYCIKWIFEKTNERWLVDFVQELEEQTIDWTKVFREFPYTRPAAHYFNWKNLKMMNGELFDEVFQYHETHIVNVVMGLKYPAMQYCFRKDEELKEVAKEAIETLKKYHGVVSGAINGDEHLSGNVPTQGAELCSIVEYMFSLQLMIEAFGSTFFADELERLAYNALPATITEDFMGHQYLQQANQVLVSRAARNWFNNDETANIFGLEPHFGCCMANLHQGWPKFVNSLWYQKSEDTVVSMVFAPSRLCTKMSKGDLEIELNTEYPFKNTLTYCVNKAPSADITIQIRIPSWCKEPQVTCANANFKQDEKWITVKKCFEKGDEIVVTLPMEIKHTYWQGDSVAVERGPLVFGLNIREEWKGYKTVQGVTDYEVYPLEAWNYALDLKNEIVIEENELGNIIFSKENPPVRLKAVGRLCEDWILENDSAGPIPISPVKTDKPPVLLELIPFGCTKLRISQFPYYMDE